MSASSSSVAFAPPCSMAAMTFTIDESNFRNGGENPPVCCDARQAVAHHFRNYFCQSLERTPAIRPPYGGRNRKARCGDAVEGGGGGRRGAEMFDGDVGRGGDGGEGGPRAGWVRGALEAARAPGIAGETMAPALGSDRQRFVRTGIANPVRRSARILDQTSPLATGVRGRRRPGKRPSQPA